PTVPKDIVPARMSARNRLQRSRSKKLSTTNKPNPRKKFAFGMSAALSAGFLQAALSTRAGPGVAPAASRHLDRIMFGQHHPRPASLVQTLAPVHNDAEFSGGVQLSRWSDRASLAAGPQGRHTLLPDR